MPSIIPYSPRYEIVSYSRQFLWAQQDSAMLLPIASARNREEFECVFSPDVLEEIKKIENDLIDSVNAEFFAVEGFCAPCNKRVPLLVDMQAGGEHSGNRWIPNWRERLECPFCYMNNRQRLIATLVKQLLTLQGSDMAKVYFMEQVTPIFHWALATFPQHKIVGSEYLGYEYPSGTVINGVRHEDAMNLSFDDNSIDLIVSNEVFEHVPDPKKVFKECVRVLHPGGILLATFPFHQNKNKTVIRAVVNDSELEFLLPPQYHGNPVSADGSLVFTDFGWDILDDLRAAGFAEIGVEIYVSAEYGHLGGGQLVFKALR